MMEETFDREELAGLAYAIKRRMIERGGEVAEAIEAVDVAMEETIQEMRERGLL